MKTYVFDTNIFLSDPNILKNYKDCKIIIPLDVINELDNHKNDSGELGANARLSSRVLEEISQHGDLISSVYFYTNEYKIDVWDDVKQELLKQHVLPDNPDGRIVITALNHNAVLISNDLIVRIKARALGVETDSYNSDNRLNKTSDIYSGVSSLHVDPEIIDNLYALGHCELPEQFHPNHYILLQSNIKDNHTAIGRWNNKRVEKIPRMKDASGIKPRNLEQMVALDALLDEKLDLVSMIGRAGTGKSILALSAAIELVLERQSYDKIILMKSPIPVGRDVGYLPGTLLEKILPYFQSYLDNLEVIFNYRRGPARSAFDILDELMSLGKIELVPPSVIRGRSIEGNFIIVDESQNMTRHEMKTIATRMGENSKLVVMGDIKQIDAKLDALDNGLTSIVESFKDEPCAAHVTLTKCERSSFADIAADKL